MNRLINRELLQKGVKITLLAPQEAKSWSALPCKLAVRGWKSRQLSHAHSSIPLLKRLDRDEGESNGTHTHGDAPTSRSTLSMAGGGVGRATGVAVAARGRNTSSDVNSRTTLFLSLHVYGDLHNLVLTKLLDHHLSLPMYLYLQ